MDTILKSYIDDFSNEYDFENKDITKTYEHFINYCVISKIDPNKVAIESVNVGGRNNPGIDGLAIIVNEHVVVSNEQVDYFVDNLNRLDCEFQFIQTKTSEKFEMGEINNFLSSVYEFFQKSTTLKFGEEILNYKDIKDYIYTKSIKMENNPYLRLFYASTGTWCFDDNLMAIIDKHLKDFESLCLFSEIKFIPVDQEKAKKLYREIKNAIKRSFSFDKYTILPQINNVSEAFIGIVSVEEYLKLISDEEGEILRNIFYDNVRDFQGFNQVNKEIKETIETDEYNDKFVLMNNGVTIVTKNLNKTGYSFTISDYQIVNGCQTSYVLHYSKSKIKKDLYIPLKLIVTDDYDVMSHIIKATNKQTEVKNEAFEILSPFHKTLEEFYLAKNRDTNNEIYYERRSHQHSSVDKSKIITLSNQITSFISMFLNEPHSTMRYFGELLISYKSKMFLENHNPYPYFISGLSLNSIDRLIQKRIINPSIKKFKYHLLMLLKLEIIGVTSVPMTSKRKDFECDKIFKILNNEEELIKIVKVCEKRINETLKNTALLRRQAHSLRNFTAELLPEYNSKRKSGYVKYYNNERGFGFIKMGSSEDVFFHIKDYQKLIKGDPSIDEELEFDIIDSNNGRRAISINNTIKKI